MATETLVESSLAEELLSRIRLQSARVCVLGLGYVGLPLAETFAARGFTVLGFDIDEEKVLKLKKGISYIGHIPSSRIAKLLASGAFDATSDSARFTEVDALVICVPTPLTEAREP